MSSYCTRRLEMHRNIDPPTWPGVCLRCRDEAGTPPACGHTQPAMEPPHPGPGGSEAAAELAVTASVHLLAADLVELRAGQVRVVRCGYRAFGDRHSTCPVDLRAGTIERYWTPRAAKQAMASAAHLNLLEAEEWLRRCPECGPAGIASSRACSQSARCEQHRPSRRSNAPTSPGLVQRSATARTVRLYPQVKGLPGFLEGTSVGATRTAVRVALSDMVMRILGALLRRPTGASCPTHVDTKGGAPSDRIVGTGHGPRHADPSVGGPGGPAPRR